jgi:hypothetical protein
MFLALILLLTAALLGSSGEAYVAQPMTQDFIQLKRRDSLLNGSHLKKRSPQEIVQEIPESFPSPSPSPTPTPGVTPSVPIVTETTTIVTVPTIACEYRRVGQGGIEKVCAPSAHPRVNMANAVLSGPVTLPAIGFPRICAPACERLRYQICRQPTASQAMSCMFSKIVTINDCLVCLTSPENPLKGHWSAILDSCTSGDFESAYHVYIRPPRSSAAFVASVPYRLILLLVLYFNL